MLAFYLSLAQTEAEKGKFERIYCQYKNLMLSCAYSILKDESLSEDAVHDAFMRILKNLSKIDEVDSPRTRGFVAVITENAAKTIYNKLNRVKLIELDETIPMDENIEQSAEQNITAEFIAEKISLLPDNYRSVMTLRYFNGLNDKEISDVLGISHALVRKRLERGRKALGKLLGGIIDE
ncbi:MAG: sigma-70 family RNA polymerase sigma factor [Ruminococcus sp.]|nr:sigma-70 family RNA polymerase sigma factor [Ruminococcus sp.]